MRNIDKINLTETSFDIFKNIVDWKRWRNKWLLQWLQADIEVLFNEYDVNKHNLINMSPNWYIWDEKDELLHCYNSDTIYSKSLKVKIRNLWNQKCPYCNIDNSRQVEHFLPKEEFPEFSFLIDNLLPTCWTCNSIKGSMWNDWSSMVLLNAYFDNIPKEQFLFVDLSIEDNIPITKFYINTTFINIDVDINIILEKHVEKLNLLDRYSKSIETKISELKKITEIKDLSIEDLKSIIEAYELQWLLYWNNYWEKVLYNEISNNEEILKYLLN